MEKWSRNISRGLTYFIAFYPASLVFGWAPLRASEKTFSTKNRSSHPAITASSFVCAHQSLAHDLFFSFVAQGDHRVDAHGAARGDISSENSHSGERKRNGGER